MNGKPSLHFISIKLFNILDLQKLTGQIALWIMLSHAIWATVVIRKKKEALRKNVHRYSLIVWLAWLILYFGGMWLAMGG